MSSAIGDYVHLFKFHYKEYGINRISDGPSVSTWDSEVQTIRDSIIIQQGVSNLINQANELQDKYNKTFYSKQNVTTDYLNAVEELINKRLQESFGIAAGKFNMNTLAVQPSQTSAKIQKAVSEIRKNYNIKKIAQKATVKQVNDTLNRVEKLLNQNVFRKTTSTKINDQIIRAKNYCQQVRNKISSWQPQVKINEIETIDGLNKIITEFSKVIPIPNQSGDAFEWLLPLIGFTASNTASQEVKQTMYNYLNSANIGEAYNKIEYKDLLNTKNSELSGKFFLDQNVGISYRAIRSKIDVSFDYTFNNGINKKMNISAKNVSRMHVKLVDSTSLYNILALSHQYNYATHYLNIITKFKEEVNQQDVSLIEEANRVTKALIIKEAAQGYTEANVAPADFLIINKHTGTSQGEIKVYNLKVLVAAIAKKIVQGKTRQGLIQGKLIPDNYSIEQCYDENDPQRRIAQVVQTIKNLKITASLNSTDLNQYIKFIDDNSLV